MVFSNTRRVLAAASLCALAWAGSVASSSAQERGIDPNQGESLVEVVLPDKAAAIRLQLDADRYGIDFNDHYLRQNRDGTVTVTVFGSEDDLDALDAAGFELGATIEGPATWRDRLADRETALRKEARADAAALGETTALQADDDQIVILRVDYFENYAGRFLSVEAKDRRAGVQADGTGYEGPNLSLSFNSGAGTPIDSTPRVMNVNVDPDTTPDTYIEHRVLVRIGDVGEASPAAPTRVRVGSSAGGEKEADVNVWLGGGLPPMGHKRLSDFTTDYMDPSQVYERFEELAAEFPNIAELITLPNKTNGYQRKAQANMSGTTADRQLALGRDRAEPDRRADLARLGPRGRQRHHGRVRRTGVAGSPLSVSVTGNDIPSRSQPTPRASCTSTAAQVVAAINAHAAASALVVALTYRGNAGAGIVQPRAKVNLSDFLEAPATVPRGPFEYKVMRIGRKRDGSKVGVFLYCQQHAREWATPLTCLETAEQLLRNYVLDGRTRELVNNLDIFILPSSNPDGAHYSMYDFSQQRRNLTNHCVNGGKETDNPFAAGFWTPRTNPQTGLPYTNTDPASRDAWGVDLNRNNTAGTIFDGYIGASLLVHQRRVRGSGGGIRAGDSQRASGSRTRSRTSSSRTTSTASAATSCGRRAPTRRIAARATWSMRTSASRSTSSPPATGS